MNSLNKDCVQVGIRGVGSYLPHKILKNSDLEKMVDTTDEWIKKKIGISERRIADNEETVEFMALEAAKEALCSAKISIPDIDAIIATSISYERKVPVLSNRIAQLLGRKDLMCLDVNVGGCCNLMAAMITAKKFIDGKSIKKVLCVASDKNSAFINWKDRSTCVIFGDGASCVILDTLEQNKGIIYTSLKGKYSEALLLPTAQIPGNEDTFLKMKGKEIFDFATENAVKAVIDACNGINIDKNDIDYFVFHQANKNIINVIMEKLDVNKDKTYTVIDKYGNTTGSSVGIALNEVVKQKKIKQGDLVALVALGGGLNWSVILLKWNEIQSFIAK